MNDVINGEGAYDMKCPECGAGQWEYLFRKGKDVAFKCGNDDCSRSEPWRNEDYLRELWVNRDLTQNEVADKLGCSNRTIQRWIKRHDIEKVEHLETKFVNGYHILRHKDGESNRKVRLHRLVAVAEYGIDAVEDMEVHHCNGVKWDNRPENLELLEKSEHSEITNRYNRLFS